VKTPARKLAEFEQLCKLIEPSPVGLLTGIDQDGRPFSQAMPAMAMDSDGAICLFADLGASHVDPWQPMTLSFGDHASASFVSMSGVARVETDRMLVEALWSPFAERWFPEGPESARIRLLKFVPRAADRWDAQRERMVCLFTTSAAVVVPSATHGRHGFDEAAEAAAALAA